MNFPADLRYTEEHEWIKIIDGNIALVGITDFAQAELGDIVFVEIETEGEELGANDIFGTIEAVKTVSDLFLPVAGKVLEVNPALSDEPELVNNSPYEGGWLIKMEIADLADVESLMDAEAYTSSIGH
ncbi:glycine cleavage system protein GcvH [Lacihabitans soyangensis]|jgi:glycine cleavage system H protein|uniref:Glycine cleavage system H protein n=1 Tax=Lacihabitans soyangensis TaxID=869394 RepID=A0AAE3KV72_9BACT|nr:glycine cleavage system protein GcvH [Lacihabitans soyangensis]MCP9763896.1 glycine cleavage system protein GcvH [Lacihabitans soyangensis]